MEKNLLFKKWKVCLQTQRNGSFTDSLFKIVKAMKKPVVGILKQAGKKVAKKGINKVSDVVVKKAGDKIGKILRKKSSERGAKRPSEATTSAAKKHDNAIVRLN